MYVGNYIHIDKLVIILALGHQIGLTKVTRENLKILEARVRGRPTQ